MDIAPLETLYQATPGNELPLPPELAAFYGRLSFPLHAGRPYVFANFVSTLDGVITLNIPGHMGGGDISGFNKQDRVVMGLLRSIADAIIVGAGTLRVEPRHIWTASQVAPDFATAYQQLRASLGKVEPPLNVFVTASGDIDFQARAFQSGEVPVLVITSSRGAERLREQHVPPSVQVVPVPGNNRITAQDILETVNAIRPGGMILLEGGAQLMGSFFEQQLLDELFLTFAPQVAGRDESVERPGFVSGALLAPEHSRWATLVSVKRGESHLFLRYSFTTEQQSAV
ncbi:MAG TPA: dihydrofolate reductase family protein [Ktedonobacteraceae bacterium]|nr:dihydrofolate reductase family protein [Ktedonobacteraceae bacterium]